MTVTEDDFPAPPGSRAAARRKPARPQLSRDAIIDVAMRLVDSDGMAGVSMRRIAQELDTGAASLYAHIANKDELYDAMIDRAAREVVPPAEGLDWQEATKHYVREVRRVLAAHRDLAGINLGRIPTGPHALAATEHMLSVMRAGGVSKQVAAFAVDMLMLLAVATAYEESIFEARFGSWEEGGAEYLEGLHAHFRALPPARFPTITSMTDELMMHGDDVDDVRFEFALEMLVRGIADRARDEAG